MKKIFLGICCAILLFSYTELCAQSCAADYLVEIKKLLKLQDCSGASNAYDIYMQLSGTENMTIHNAIMQCFEDELIRLSDSYESSAPTQEQAEVFMQEFDGSYEAVLAELEHEKKSYVDLGLPSGTKWKNKNEDRLQTHNEAVVINRIKIPSKEQWEELKEKCRWTWMGNGYYVTGPNGASIFLPAEGLENSTGNKDFVGFRGYYVTSSPFNVKSSYTFNFNAEDFYLNMGGNDDYKLSIRFIKKD